MHPLPAQRSHTSLVILLICLAAVACGPSGPATPPSELEAETNDRAVLAGNTETQIPATATDIHGYITGFRDVTTYVRFTLPSSDLLHFLRSTACPPTLETTDIRSDMQRLASFAWWQPGAATDYKWCDGTTQNLVQRVYLDLSDQNHVIVYITASTR